MKVIVMPYFPLGSVASFAWTAENVHVLQSCLYVACLCYIDAYSEHGFVHHDFHAANIMLKATKQKELKFSGDINARLHGVRPWIGDFEKSQVTKRTPLDEQYFKYDLQKLFFFLPTLVPQVHPGSVGDISSYIQNAPDPCNDTFRRQLEDVIRRGIRVMI
jgi:hypothetical protein